MIEEGNCTEVNPTPSPSNKDGNLKWLWIVLSSLTVFAIIVLLCILTRKRIKKVAYRKKEEQRLMNIRDESEDDDDGENSERLNS